MVAKKPRRSSTDSKAPIYQLKIELLGVEPLVWRRLRVRGDINLGLLHAVFQVAMGWTNSHMHQFDIGERLYANQENEPDDDFGGPPILDEHVVLLLNVVPKAKAVFTYTYDFGDGWMHQIQVEKIAGPDPKMLHFGECVDGRRACPPDDCGGPGGYAELLEAIGDPDHEEHESMLEWVGGRFDPAAFDLKRINAALGKLKWPHMTDTQLARVLMQRDRSRGWAPNV